MCVAAYVCAWQRWSAAYRSAELTFLLYTNNGTKSMNEDFRHEFMSSCAEASLSELLGNITRRQLPALLGTFVPHTSFASGCFLFLLFLDSLSLGLQK